MVCNWAGIHFPTFFLAILIGESSWWTKVYCHDYGQHCSSYLWEWPFNNKKKIMTLACNMSSCSYCHWWDISLPRYKSWNICIIRRKLENAFGRLVPVESLQVFFFCLIFRYNMSNAFFAKKLALLMFRYYFYTLYQPV